MSKEEKHQITAQDFYNSLSLKQLESQKLHVEKILKRNSDGGVGATPWMTKANKGALAMIKKAISNRKNQLKTDTTNETGTGS